VIGGDASQERPRERPPVVVATGDVASWPQVDRFIRPNCLVKMDGASHVNLSPSAQKKLSPAFLFHSALANMVCSPIGFWAEPIGNHFRI